MSENDQTDGEYDDEDSCSCPNTPLRGYVCEAEFAFPPYQQQHRHRQYHCNQQDIIGMKGRQAGQPIPPPKPARTHLTQQSIQQVYKQEYNAGGSNSKVAAPKEGNRNFHTYHDNKKVPGDVVLDPDMTDGYHEFIKDSTQQVNKFSRKYIDIVTPRTYPNSNVQNGTNEPKCPHGVPIRNEVHTNDSMIKGLDDGKINQSVKTDYSKNQVAQPTTSAISKPRVDTVLAARPSVTNTESLKVSKVNEVTHSKALSAGAVQVVSLTTANKKSLSEVDGSKHTTYDHKLVKVSKATDQNTKPTTQAYSATTTSSSSTAAAGPAVGAAGGISIEGQQEAGKSDSACSGTSVQPQVRNKIPPKTKPKPTRVGVVPVAPIAPTVHIAPIVNKDLTKDKDKDIKDKSASGSSNATAGNNPDPENKNEMSLEIKSAQSSNDEDPGYASVEEIPLDSPGKDVFYSVHVV